MKITQYNSALDFPFTSLCRIIRGKIEKYTHCHKPETVQHFYSYIGRMGARTEMFRNRMNWRSRILKQPLEVLEYLTRERVTLEAER